MGRKKYYPLMTKVNLSGSRPTSKAQNASVVPRGAYSLSQVMVGPVSSSSSSKVVGEEGI